MVDIVGACDIPGANKRLEQSDVYPCIMICHFSQDKSEGHLLNWSNDAHHTGYIPASVILG